MVKVPVVTFEVLSPLVVLKVTLSATPLVLAAKAIVPFWLMSLLEMKVMFDPLAPVIVPPT